MTSRLVSCLISLSIAIVAVHAQTTSKPFASLDRAVSAERGKWAGDKSKLSAVFDSERRQLGDKFEAELLKWLGDDVEKHYWISYFLEVESYLHGNKRLPHLSLLVKEQALRLVRDKDDEDSQGYVVSFAVTAAELSAELGFSSLAISYKDEAETLLKKNSDLRAHVPAMYDDERSLYDKIPLKVDTGPAVTVTPPSILPSRPTVIGDPNPPPKARVSAGVLVGKNWIESDDAVTIGTL